MYRVLLGVVLSVLSCGGGMARIEQSVNDLQRRLDEVAGASRATQNRLAALENRILLLQDEVETLQLAVHRGGSPRSYAPIRAVPPTPPQELPTVRLSPSSEANARVAPSSGPPPLAMDDSMYQEIDEEGKVVTPSRRSQKSAGAAGLAPPSRGAAPRPAAETDTVLQEYQAAYELYRQGRVVEARMAFEAFVSRYPKHSYADNAQYWVGECLYDQKDFEGARRAFLRVLTDHPDGNKVPDAMVKVGLCDRALGRHEDALRMFRTVMLTYPESDAAAVAMRLAGETP